MFEKLSEKLTGIFRRLGDKGVLSEQDVDAALREVRLALLEADVNFRVVRSFIASIKERALDQELLKSLSPGQQVIKIASEELTEVLGGAVKALGAGIDRPFSDADGRPERLGQDNNLSQDRRASQAVRRVHISRSCRPSKDRQRFSSSKPWGSRSVCRSTPKTPQALRRKSSQEPASIEAWSWEPLGS